MKKIVSITIALFILFSVAAQEHAIIPLPQKVESRAGSLQWSKGVKIYYSHPQLNERALIWHTPNKWTPNDGPGINYRSAIRKGDWKLVYSLRNGKSELYNIKKDIGEQNDVSAQNHAIVQALLQQLSSQLRQWKAPMPTIKATGKVMDYAVYTNK